MLDSQVTVLGNVATDVRHLVTDGGVHIAKFRLAATRRRFDRTTREWVDAGTSFYSVTAWRYLAQNAASSLRKGDPVIVTGALQVRDWSAEDGRSGTSVEIDAASLGHDLTWGVATFQRITRTREVGRSEEEAWRALGGAEGSDGAEGHDGAEGQDGAGTEADAGTGELVADGRAAA